MAEERADTTYLVRQRRSVPAPTPEQSPADEATLMKSQTAVPSARMRALLRSNPAVALAMQRSIGNRALEQVVNRYVATKEAPDRTTEATPGAARPGRPTQTAPQGRVADPATAANHAAGKRTPASRDKERRNVAKDPTGAEPGAIPGPEIAPAHDPGAAQANGDTSSAAPGPAGDPASSARAPGAPATKGAGPGGARPSSAGPDGATARPTGAMPGAAKGAGAAAGGSGGELPGGGVVAAIAGPHAKAAELAAGVPPDKNVLTRAAAEAKERKPDAKLGETPRMTRRRAKPRWPSRR